MDVPCQITFRGVSRSEALEQQVREKAARLHRLHTDITGCRVVIEADHHSRHKGNLYHVRLEVSARGKDIVVSNSHNDNHAHEDAYVVVRDAFDAARRQLEASAPRKGAGTAGRRGRDAD